MKTLTNPRIYPEASNKNTWARRWFGCSSPVLFLYAGLCVTLAMMAYLRPLPTFDRYMYAGAVASLRYSDPVTIHRIARAEFVAQPDPFQFENVATEPYFADVYNNADHYVQQLAFYRVKFGYIAIGYAMWRSGLPVLAGLRLVSAFCFAALGLVVLAWTHKAALSAILLLTPPVLDLGRFVTPDALSTVIIVSAMLLFTRKKYLPAVCLLVFSLLIRFDGFVFVLILLIWMVWQRRISFSLGAVFGALVVAESVLMNRIAAYYGWRVLMQHSFIKPEIEPAIHPVGISLAGYLHAIVGLRVIPYTFMTMFVLMAAIAWKRLPSKSALHHLLLVAGISILARLVIFPNVEDRYFAWAYLLAAVALIQTVHFPNLDSAEDASDRDL